MKKLTALFATLAIALTLSAPVFAKKHHPAKKVYKKSAFDTFLRFGKKKGPMKGQKKSWSGSSGGDMKGRKNINTVVSTSWNKKKGERAGGAHIGVSKKKRR